MKLRIQFGFLTPELQTHLLHDTDLPDATDLETSVGLGLREEVEALFLEPLFSSLQIGSDVIY